MVQHLEAGRVSIVGVDPVLPECFHSRRVQLEHQTRDSVLLQYLSDVLPHGTVAANDHVRRAGIVISGVRRPTVDPTLGNTKAAEPRWIEPAQARHLGGEHHGDDRARQRELVQVVSDEAQLQAHCGQHERELADL